MAAIIAATSKAQKLAEYRAARDQGVAWLLTQLQPDGALGDPQQGFHSRSKHTIISEYPEADRRWYIVENQVARPQRWTIGGIAAGFLRRLYLADPNPAYVDLARKYQAFSIAATPRQFEFPQVSKSSWGSSLLYKITGEEPYLEWTYRLGDWYVAGQKEDGRWQYDPNARRGALIELTLEFVMHVDTLMAGLASRP
jgi:hypothetical protein